jgi:hypothetical protein
VQLRVEYDLVIDILALDLGYARLFKGRFSREAPNAPDPHDVSYGYASILFSF